MDNNFVCFENGWVAAPDLPTFSTGAAARAAGLVPGGLWSTPFGGLRWLTATEVVETQVAFPDGTAALPGLAFDADKNTGFYRPGSDTIGFSTGGTAAMNLLPDGSLQLVSTKLLGTNKSTTGNDDRIVMSCSTGADATLGAYLALYGRSHAAKPSRVEVVAGTSGDIRFVVGATLVDQITVTGQHLGLAGTGALPTYSFDGDPDTGVYRIDANEIGFSAGGVLTGGVDGAGVYGTNGNPAAPGLSLMGARNCGLSRGADTESMNISAGGVLVGLVLSDGSIRLGGVGANLTYGVLGTADSATLSGSGSASRPSGAYFTAYGNTHATKPGRVEIMPGSAGYTDLFGPAGGVRASVNDQGVQVNSGTSALPGLAFLGDPNSGVYSIGSDLVGISSGGTLACQFGETGTLVFGTSQFSGDLQSWTLRLSSAAQGDGLIGSLGASLVFAGTTGRRRAGLVAEQTGSDADQFGLGFWVHSSTTTTNDVLVKAAVITHVGQFLGSAGTAALPGASFIGDPNTGVYNVSADVLGFSTGGVLRASIDVSGINVAPGSVALPGFGFIGDPDTGIYGGVANTLYFGTAGVERGYIGSTGYWRANVAVNVGGPTGGAILDPTAGSQDGVSMAATGQMVRSQDGNLPFDQRRRTSVGSIQRFYYGVGTLVGSIDVSTTGTTYQTTSDERLKNMTGDMSFEKAMSIIEALPVKEWTWNHVFGDHKGLGWGAQTAFQHVPEVVSRGDYGRGRPGDKDFEQWGMSKADMVPYVWAAVAGMRKQQVADAERIAALEAKLEALMARFP